MAIYLESSTERWKLPQGVSTLGRGADCDIRLNDLRLSRRHARIIVEGEELLVEDIGSTNGVLVDGDVVEHRQVVPPGAELTIGPFTFRASLVAEEGDPSQVRSESISKPSRTTRRRSSEEFSPSTDQSWRQTQDMDSENPVGTPVARPDTEPSGVRKQGDKAAALTQRRGNRRLAPSIEEALDQGSSTDNDQGHSPQAAASQAQQGSTRHADTDALMPSNMGRERKSDALLPIDDSGRPMRDPERALSLTPLAVEDAPQRARLIAGAVDGLLILGSGALVAALVGSGAYHLAHHLSTETHGEEWWQVAQHWHHHGDLAWWWFYSGVVLGLVLGVLAMLYLAVARTTLYGGPPAHRRLGLVIIDQRSGHFPTPAKAWARYVLLLLSAPAAAVAVILGTVGLHDGVLGCRVMRRAPL